MKMRDAIPACQKNSLLGCRKFPAGRHGAALRRNLSALISQAKAGAAEDWQRPFREKLPAARELQGIQCAAALRTLVAALATARSEAVRMSLSMPTP